MKNRAIAGVAVLAVVLALVGLAVVAGRDSGGAPATLPVLGAGGESSTAAAPSADSKMRVAPVRYEAGKLPGLADEADAWTIAPGGLDEDRVAELAKLLDVEGKPTKTEAGWTVGTETRRLDVQTVAGLPWSLYETVPAVQVDPAPPTTVVCIKAPCNPPTDTGGGSSACPPGAMCKDAPSTTIAAGECPPNANCATTSTPACAPDQGCPEPGSCAADGPDCPMTPVEPQRPADLPSKAEAEVQGRKLLTKLGVDLDQADVKVEDGYTVWSVMADPIIGGLPTIGLTSSIGIGSKGVVQYANGWLGDVTKGDTYPLIGAAAGVERLNAEQSRLLIAPNVRCDGCEAQDQVEPRVVRVTGVRLGLQLFSTYEPGATGYLVPTYLFSTDDGGEIPVVAVADQYLGQQQPTPEPDDHGTPAEPSDDACSASGSGSAGGATPTPDVQVQVCGPTTAKVGETVTFTVTAKGQVRDDCGSPVPEWGDGSDVPVCAIGCESLPTEPKEVSKTFEHAYAEAGSYTVAFHLLGCGDSSGKDQATAQAEVHVEG